MFGIYLSLALCVIPFLSIGIIGLVKKKDYQRSFVAITISVILLIAGLAGNTKDTSVLSLGAAVAVSWLFAGIMGFSIFPRTNNSTDNHEHFRPG